tara:strand:- start:419 stop:1069 length:651 start_codon:yes stop_codon:yes gene_type:complete
MIQVIAGLVLAVSIPNAGSEIPDVYDVADAMRDVRPSLTRDDAMTLAGAALEAGVRYEVDPLFLLGVAYVESRWNRKVKAGDGGKSFGLFQMTFSVGKRVDFAGLFEDELEYCGNGSQRDAMRWALEDTWNAFHVAAAYIAHLRRKYGKRRSVYDVMVIYNCGPTRCKQSNGKQRRVTPATRGYWKAYRRLKKFVKEYESMKCEPGKPEGYKEKDA